MAQLHVEIRPNIDPMLPIPIKLRHTNLKWNIEDLTMYFLLNMIIAV